ncbi:MAG: RHS repeat-associated core domain-containing protein [Terriglobales bacterium]
MYDASSYAYDGALPHAYKFTGKERDAETGLDFFGARFYSSGQGRWLSPDWSATPEAVPYADITDPQSLNLYGYVRNNPMSRADADGHDTTRPGDDWEPNFRLATHRMQVTTTVLSFVPGVVGRVSAVVNAVISAASGDVKGAAASAAMAMIPGGSKLTKAEQLAINAEKGAASEAKVLGELGVAKNTEKGVGTEGKSIPDINTKTTIGEIKDAQRVSNTEQLRIQKDAAEQSEKQHELYTGTNTHVTDNAAQGTRVIRRDDLGPK